MKRSKEEFWHSPLAQITKMIDMYNDEINMTNAITENKPYNSKYFNNKVEEIEDITSMKQIKGW
jgi:hypothetical protein